MKTPEYLFDHLDEFERFRDSKTSIITDIDGTISEIAPTPDKAVVSPVMRALLKKLAEKFKLVALVTGRCVEDAKRIVGVDGLLYVGNHGLEYLKDGEIFIEPEVRKYLPAINEVTRDIQKGELCKIDGIIFEEKGICFSIHYRLCEDPERAKEKVLDTLKNRKGSGDLKIKEGRRVVELRPPMGYDKGTILQKIVSDNHIEKLIYLGDDITDSDAFYKLKELKNEGLIDGESIFVASTEVPEYVRENATYFVESVEEIAKFMDWISKD
ncbi:MAG: trehalose-phosphatase [Euryarchaeota archaeon]|nr:trehalose-phosphatase [Euryarchaeota archaeon]